MNTTFLLAAIELTKDGLPILGGLVSVGALGWWIRSGTDLKLTQRDAAEAKKKADEALTQSNVLLSRVNQQDTIIQEIRTRMAKLDQLPELVATMEFIKDAITRSLVPRAELERKWEADEERIGRIEEELRLIKEQRG